MEKKKLCSDIVKWQKGIINHFWWSCESSGGNAIELREKWTSLVHHISNRHSFGENTVFKKCQHPSLPHDQLRNSKWLKVESPARNAMKEIVLDKKLLDIVPYLVDFCHTGNLKVYHAVLLKYCPKQLHFSYHGMIARTQLAVLHFNHVIDAGHAKTKEGNLRYKLQFSKLSQNYMVKPIKDVKEKPYLKDLVCESISMATHITQLELPKLPNFPKNIAPINQTRFSES